MPLTPSEKRTIAIIGAGFSGTLTAVNILRTSQSHDLRVVLIEQAPVHARGLAYRSRDDNHLLNVPAGNMSALVDEPDHFVSYCQNIDPALNAGSFISRRLYGEYLQNTLEDAETHHPGVLEKITDEAIAVCPDASGNTFRVALASGSSLNATQVVLALGHFPPRPPAAVPEALYRHIVDPWDFTTLDSLDPDKPVVILGTGHTAIDALFRLTSCNTTRKVVLLSRRGLLPHGHRFNPSPPCTSDYPAYLAGLPPTIRAYTRALRREAARREADGGNWRDVINELRPHAARLWQGLPESEQRRSLRGVATYWDIHRHRLAPVATRRLERLLESGQVERIAGQVAGLDMYGANLRVQIKERHQAHARSLDIGAIVNCTGPNYDLSALSLPLVTQLGETGLIQQDRLKLGLLVDDDYRVIGAHNETVPGLFYIGPMLKARYWEAIAVPELRQHAYQLARNLTRPRLHEER